jgi:hypothetical protein
MREKSMPHALGGVGPAQKAADAAPHDTIPPFAHPLLDAVEHGVRRLSDADALITQVSRLAAAGERAQLLQRASGLGELGRGGTS